MNRYFYFIFTTFNIFLTDLNGDGLDDVIVGAPMWSNFEVMGKYETGRVYVYYQHFTVSKNTQPKGEIL